MKKYEGYKATQLEWLSQIPLNWDYRRLKRVQVSLTENTTDNSRPYIGMENVESWTGRLIRKNSIQPSGISSTYHVANILFGKLRPYLAKVYLAKDDGICSGEFLVLHGIQNTNQQYFRYLLSSAHFINLVNSSTYGAKMPRASWDFIGNCMIPVPPRSEQDQIVRYLDWRVSKISKLIAAKKRQTGLLNARRQKIITTVVTRGLRQEPLVDSGVRWIGSIPQSWLVTTLGRCASVRSGITLGKTYPTEKELVNVPYLRVANVQNGYIDISDLAKLSVTQEEAEKYQLPTGCVLMTEGGDRDKLGRGCVWDGQVSPCIHQNHIFAVTVNPQILSNFYLEYLTISDIGRLYFDITQHSGIKTMPCQRSTKMRWVSV